LIKNQFFLFIILFFLRVLDIADSLRYPGFLGFLVTGKVPFFTGKVPEYSPDQPEPKRTRLISGKLQNQASPL
jgi:hypothetical protein